MATLYAPTRGSTIIVPGIGPAGAEKIPTNDIDNEIYATTGLEFMFDGLSLVSPGFLAVDRRGDLAIRNGAENKYPAMAVDAAAPGATGFNFTGDATTWLTVAYELPPQFTIIHVCTPLDSSVTEARSLAGHNGSSAGRVRTWMTQAAPAAPLAFRAAASTAGSPAPTTGAVIPPGVKCVPWYSCNGVVNTVGFNGSTPASQANTAPMDTLANFIIGGTNTGLPWLGRLDAVYVVNRALHVAGTNPLNDERDALLALIGSRHGVSW